MSVVKFYTTDNCPYCRSAKALLDARKIEYQELNLERSPEMREQLQELTGMSTFPQILVNDEPIGGFQELVAADRSGRLAELLGA